MAVRPCVSVVTQLDTRRPEDLAGYDGGHAGPVGSWSTMRQRSCDGSTILHTLQIQSGPTLDHTGLFNLGEVAVDENLEIHQRIDAAIANLPAGIPPDKIAVSWPIGSYIIEDGYITIHHIFRGKICGTRQILDVSGSGVTGEDGTRQFGLNAFHCQNRRPGAGEGRFSYDHPINVLATPDGDAPIYLTTRASIGTDSNDQSLEDVIITVYAWNASGAPEPAAVFDWRCRVLFSVGIG